MVCDNITHSGLPMSASYSSLSNLFAGFDQSNIYEQYKCCGITIYDNYEKKCCTGASLASGRVQNMLCCGAYTYDSSQQVCCYTAQETIGNVPSPAGENNTACCGSGPD